MTNGSFGKKVSVLFIFIYRDTDFFYLSLVSGSCGTTNLYTQNQVQMQEHADTRLDLNSIPAVIEHKQTAARLGTTRGAAPGGAARPPDG